EGRRRVPALARGDQICRWARRTDAVAARRHTQTVVDAAGLSAGTGSGRRLAADPGAHPPPAPLVVVTLFVVAVGALDVLPRWPGLPDLVALPPLDLMTDIRVLLALAPGWVVFGIGLPAALAVRVVLLSWLLGGPDRDRLLFALRFYLLAAVPAFAAAGLLYVASVTLFAALFWAGALITLIVLLPLAALPWMRRPSLRAAARNVLGAPKQLAPLLRYLGAIALLSVVSAAVPPSLVLALVPVSAALSWLTMSALASAARQRRLRFSAAAARVTGTVLGLATLGGIAVLALLTATAPGPEPAAAPAHPQAGSLLLVGGVDTRSGGGPLTLLDPAALGFTCPQVYYFSYAGPGAGAAQGQARCPIRTGAPYSGRDTLQPAATEVAAFEAQVRALPRPVTVVAHSLGGWIAWEAVSAGRAPGVTRVVLVGTYPGKEVGYPTRGSGAGAGGRGLLALTAWLSSKTGFSSFDPDAPAAVDWLADPARLGRVFARPLPAGVRALGVFSMFDEPLLPDGPTLPHGEQACAVPEPHPALPYTAQFRDVVRRFLDGTPQPGCSWWSGAVGPPLRHLTVPPTDG
ncbi:MAG: hypothetical protein ACXV3F_06430, partial [Frankiaceae bacterium]